MSDPQFCDQCGGLNRETARFCAHCGNALDEALTAVETQLKADPGQPLPFEHRAPLAEQTGRQGSSRRVRRGLKVLAVAVAGLVLYGAYNAGAAVTYASANQAYEELNCSSAEPGFSRVAGVFALSLATPRSESEARRHQCHAVNAAVAFAKDRNHRAAASAYATAIKMGPAPSIEPLLATAHAREVLSWSDQLVKRSFAAKQGKLLAAAMRNYLTVYRQEGGALSTRAKVGLVRIGVEIDATALAGHPCAAATYASSLAGVGDRTGIAPVDTTFSQTKRGRFLFDCGEQYFSSHRFHRAEHYYRQLIHEFPAHPLVTTARQHLIAAEVAAIRGKRTARLPNPVVAGSSGSSSVDISIRNSSPYAFELLLSGPDARRVVLPACAGCKKYPVGSEPSSCPPGRETSITILPGSYSVVARSTTERSVEPWSGDWNLSGGYRYAHCFYIMTS